jgi:hypothetical protein
VVFQLLPTEEGKKNGVKDPEDMVKSVHGDEHKVNNDDDELD